MRCAWWGNGEWRTITVEAQRGNRVTASGASPASTLSASQRARKRVGLSGRAGDGVDDVSFTDVDLIIAADLSNYSDGRGPPCSALYGVTYP